MQNLKNLRENLAARLISRVTKHTTPAPQPGHNKPKFLNKMDKKMKHMGEGRAEDAFADLDKAIEKKEKGDNTPTPIQPKRASEIPGKPIKLKDMNPLDRDQWEKEKRNAGITN